MPSCIVSGCIHKTTKKNCNEEGFIMHAFPSSLSRIKLWLRSIEKNNHQYFGNIDALAENIFYKKNNSSFRICSDHFISECYAPGHSKRRALRQDAIPTIFSAPLILTALHDNTPPQHVPFMVDAITQTDPYINTEDKGAQWPEFEFNVGGQPWKIEHDHVYHNLRSTGRNSQRPVSVGSLVNTVQYEENPLIHGLRSPKSSEQKGALAADSSRYSIIPNQEYTPHSSVYSQRENCMRQEVYDRSCVKERKFIVFESCLDVLFEKATCRFEDCSAPVVDTQKHVLGSYLSVTGRCCKGHIFQLWHSQPTRGQIAIGNVLSSAAIFFSGSNFLKVQEMCQLLGLQFISHSVYDIYQRKYLFPTVDIHWQQERLRLNEASLGTQLCLAGSGQCSTSANGSKYGTYTFLDVATKRIVDFETVQGTEASSSAAMKRNAFTRCLSRILQDHFQVASIATDYHPKIKKTCEQYYRIQHEYDVWHYTKGLEKRLLAASKKENCSVIADWIPSINKHLWWCSSTSNGNVRMLRERWQSVLMHVTDQHEWDNAEMYHACAHRKFTEQERQCRPWIKENSQPYLALYDVVMNPQVNKDLENLSQFLHTGEIEVYHSFLSKYRPKRTHFKMDAVEARIKLAALAHNANVHRQRAQTKFTGQERAAIGTLRHDVVSPKSKKTCVSKTLYEPTTNTHVLPMLTDVLKFFDCRITNDWSSWSSTLKDSSEQRLNKRRY